MGGRRGRGSSASGREAAPGPRARPRSQLLRDFECWISHCRVMSGRQGGGSQGFGAASLGESAHGGLGAAAGVTPRASQAQSQRQTCSEPRRRQRPGELARDRTPVGAGRGLLAADPTRVARGLPSRPAPRAPAPTDVVLLFAGDGVAAYLSVLDGRQAPAGTTQSPEAAAAGTGGLGRQGTWDWGGRGRGRGRAKGGPAGATARRVPEAREPLAPRRGQGRGPLTFSRSAPSHPALPGGLACSPGRAPAAKRGQGSDQGCRGPAALEGVGPGASTPPHPRRAGPARPLHAGLTGMPCSWGLSSRLWSSFLEASIFSWSAASTMYLGDGRWGCSWPHRPGWEWELPPGWAQEGAPMGQPARTTGGPAHVPPRTDPGEAAARSAKLGNTGPVR